MIRQVLESSRYLKEDSMHSQKNSPACFLRWSVSKVTDRLYAVAATVDGKEYDFVGNFKSVREAQQIPHRSGRTRFYSRFRGSTSLSRSLVEGQPSRQKELLENADHTARIIRFHETLARKS